jgi:DNA-binding response OmpR family regulator
MQGGADQQRDKTGIRVLVVQGNPKHAANLRKSLEAAPVNFVVSPARQLWSATQILAGIAIDAVLLDPALPDSEGLSGVQKLREQSPDVPMLVVGDDEQFGRQAVEAGADDFLGRADLDPKRLGVRIVDAIERRRAQVNAQVNMPAPVAPPAASILLVDDDPWVQRLLLRNLERQGHRVVASKTPQEALAWAEGVDDHVDLLVCDIHLPGMGGMRLSAHLRRRFEDMMTLLLVSSNIDSPVEAAEQGARFACLRRPYSLEEFQEVVEDLLAAAHARAELQPS